MRTSGLGKLLNHLRGNHVMGEDWYYLRQRALSWDPHCDAPF